jgi:hypothetical protein
MTFVGKMLVVVQLVMSLVFMAFAAAVYSVQQSWKEEAASLQQQVSDLQNDLSEQNTTLQRKVTDATQTAEAAVARAETAEGVNAQLKAQLANEQQNINELNLQNNSMQGVALAKSAEAAFRDEEAQRGRIAYQTLRNEVDTLNSELRDRDDQIFAMQLEMEDLASRYDTLLAESGDLKKILRMNDLPTDPTEFTALEEPPPPVDGIVVDTKADESNRVAAVQISIGSDDGVRKNHVLDVYSSAANGGQTQYLGKIRVFQVTPHWAVGYVIQSSKNGIIQRGDNVTTRL